MLRSFPELVAEARADLRCVDAQTARAEIAENGGLLIDVREAGEAGSPAVAGAVNIPRGVLELNIGELAADAGQPLYLHCATGGRATIAAQQLQKMGYENVSVITCPVTTVSGVMASDPASKA